MKEVQLVLEEQVQQEQLVLMVGLEPLEAQGLEDPQDLMEIEDLLDQMVCDIKETKDYYDEFSLTLRVI